MACSMSDAESGRVRRLSRRTGPGVHTRHLSATISLLQGSQPGGGVAGVSAIDKLDAVGFDELLRQQNPFADPACRFDLRGVRFVTPAGLVQLAAACHALHQGGRRPVITLANTTVPSYLLRANFEAVVRPVARFNPPFKRRYLGAFDHLHGGSPLLIEVTKLEASGELPALLDRVVAVLRGELGYPKGAAFDVAIAVSEASQNTFDHNGPTCGFFAMQVYHGHRGSFLEIGVADCGDGLAASLRRNPKTPVLVSDHEAIAYATRLGTSEYDDPTHGRGLYHLLEITYKHGGSVQLRSGSAVARYRMDQRQGWAFAVPPMPGVHLALTLPALR